MNAAAAPPRAKLLRWLLPKSLNGLLLLGLAVLAGPLLYATLTATAQMRHLFDYSQRLVAESVQTTRLSRDLYAQIALLERSAQFYQVLGDPAMLETYHTQDGQLSSLVRSLGQQLHTPAERAQLAALEGEQASIRAMVLDTKPSTNPHPDPALTTAFVGLSDTANRIATLSNQQIDRDVGTLRTQTERARRGLFIESTLLLPLLLGVVLLFALRLSRPLRQIDRAITELGRGNLAHAIAVSGPLDLERLGRQLEWLRCRLLELAQERNRFLQHMSHELKTPLANIREGTELLMDGAVGPLDAGQREVTAILRDNGVRLQRLIENLLSFSAWQSNSTGLDVSEFRLRPLVKQVLESHQLTLVAQRVRLDVSIEDLALAADRGKIRLILENLLSNAIKYSPRGGAIFLRAAADGELLQLDVGDSGPGIAPAERARIFEAFYTGRAPGGLVRGTGIGLSVVHEFVHVHGGTVDIIDGHFPGAHFRIRMPLRAAALRQSVAGRQAHAA